jgi:Lrp/AsnC family transcriptional regulator, leucine-responsive regulatory protein
MDKEPFDILPALPQYERMSKLDTTNQQILEILQKDSSITNSELATRIGLAPASTLERVKKLEKSGTIRKYVALLDPEKVNRKMTVIIEVSVSDHSSEAIREFIEKTTSLKDIQECHLVAGSRDFILKAVTEDMESYKKLATEELGNLPYIDRIESIFVLSTEKDETALPV